MGRFYQNQIALFLPFIYLIEIHFIFVNFNVCEVRTEDIINDEHVHIHHDHDHRDGDGDDDDADDEDDDDDAGAAEDDGGDDDDYDVLGEGCK